MKYFFLLIVVLLTPMSISAQFVEDNFKVDVSTYSDGVLLETRDAGYGLQLRLGGPGHFRFSQTYSAAESAFIDINNVGGQTLEDGFYKYEVWPLPAVTYSREESSAMPDRNSIENTTGPKVSSVSGSFRIVAGLIVDPELVEFGANTAEGQ